ncbi:hypothetical protein [Actinoplanes sp. NPDC049681]|uniref:hypothetical protein n=1 Tax=Actinoplanes sp. NPDC049681 TaxID=3363905 RepID=UPI00379C5CD8
MWIYAETVTSSFDEHLQDLLEELRSRGVRRHPLTLRRSERWGDVDYTFGGTISVKAAGASADGYRPVVVRPQVWFEVHQLVIGRPAEPVRIEDFHGTDIVTWLLCHQVGGRDLDVDGDGPRFVVDLASSREAQWAARPSAADLSRCRQERCECAQRADDGPCEGPRDLLRVIDGDKTMYGCYRHASAVVGHSQVARAEPGSTRGYTEAALAAAARDISSKVPPPPVAPQASPGTGAPPPHPAARPPWWRQLLMPRR